MKRILLLVTFAAAGAFHAWPQPKIDAVVNAASFEKGLPAGGSLATVYLSGLLTKTQPGTYLASSPVPYQLGGFSVSVNDALAPILAVVVSSSGGTKNAQINFQVPMERNASPSGYSGVMGVGAIDDAGAVLKPLPESEWGGFFSGANGYAVAQHASDYSRVTPENPARPGETIIAYATDFFSVWPYPPVGSPVPLQPLFQLPPPPFARRAPGCLFLQDYPVPSVGQSIPRTPPLQTPFLGLAPGMIGVEQVNFVVPPNQQPGDWALFFNIGSCNLLPGEQAGRGASSRVLNRFGGESPPLVWAEPFDRAAGFRPGVNQAAASSPQ